MLGPLLFLYINDMPSKDSSSVRLFADDCLLYKVIQGNKDAELLQEDLDQLQEWEKDWQMLFNLGKCEHIRITNKRRIIQTSFTIHGQKLKETSEAKYLGITIDDKLTWNSHTDIVTIKFPFKRTVCPVFLMNYCPIIPRKPSKVQYSSFDTF